MEQTKNKIQTKYIKSNNNLFVIDIEDDFILDKIPTGVYKFKETQNGVVLEKKMENFNVPAVLYGKENNRRVQKVIKRFEDTQKLGVLFIGKKGSGKTHSVKLVANEIAEKNKYPIFMIENLKEFEMFKNLSSKIGNCIIVFDEFEKNISKKAQENLLTLFDGLYNSDDKKLFLLSANYKDKIIPEFFNRPERIRFVFQYAYLDTDVVDEYLQKNLIVKNDKIIEKIQKLNLNFDILKTIVSELNYGEDLSTTLKDLGIDTKIKVVIEEYETDYNGTLVKDKLKNKIFIEFDIFSGKSINIPPFFTETFYKLLCLENINDPHYSFNDKSKDEALKECIQKRLRTADEYYFDSGYFDDIEFFGDNVIIPLDEMRFKTKLIGRVL